MNEQFHSVMQIAEALAENRLPIEIVAAIAKKRPSFGVAELVELLSRAKEVQTDAEKLQRRAAILMEVLEEILKAFPDLAAAATGGPERPRT